MSFKKILKQNLGFLAFYNAAPKTSDVNWMNAIFYNNNKVSEHKLGPFEHAQSMSKQPARLVYVGSYINYLSYLAAPFPRGMCIDLEGSITFLPLMLLIYIDRIRLVWSLV